MNYKIVSIIIVILIIVIGGFVFFTNGDEATDNKILANKNDTNWQF